MADCFAILNEILSNESPWVTNQDSWDKYIKTLQSKKANISSKEELNDLCTKLLHKIEDSPVRKTQKYNWAWELLVLTKVELQYQ